MNHDDILKLKAVALYILKQCRETDFIHLFKIMYFAERSHYAAYGKHLVKDTFCALERGPVPSTLYNALKVTTGQKAGETQEEIHLAKAFEQCEAECHYIVRAAQEPDMDELSPAEIASLDSSISEHQGQTSWELSAKSHDQAWRSAWEKQHSSPMSAAEIALAGGAERGFVDYIAAQERIDHYLSDGQTA